MITIGIPVYEGVNLLDVAGPVEMFSWIPKSKRVTTTLVSQDGAAVTTLSGITLGVHDSFERRPTFDVLWTPGGDTAALTRLMKDPDSPYLAYLRQVAADARWICSVCEGAMLLARAGLLDGHQATTHWAFTECLAQFPKIQVMPGHPRFVVSGNRLTGGGISSGLDEALKLIEMLTDTQTATSIQVTTQYFPDPPVHGSIPATPPACPFSW